MLTCVWRRQFFCKALLYITLWRCCELVTCANAGMARFQRPGLRPFGAFGTGNACSHGGLSTGFPQRAATLARAVGFAVLARLARASVHVCPGSQRLDDGSKCHFAAGDYCLPTGLLGRQRIRGCQTRPVTPIQMSRRCLCRAALAGYSVVGYSGSPARVAAPAEIFFSRASLPNRTVDR